MQGSGKGNIIVFNGLGCPETDDESSSSSGNGGSPLVTENRIHTDTGQLWRECRTLSGLISEVRGRQMVRDLRFMVMQCLLRADFHGLSNLAHVHSTFGLGSSSS